MTKHNLEREQFILFYIFWSQTKRGSQSKSWRQEPGAEMMEEAAYWPPPLDNNQLVPYTVQSHLPNGSNSHSVLGLPTSMNQDNFQWTWQQNNLMPAILQWRLPQIHCAVKSWELTLTRTLSKIGIVPVNLICQWEMFVSSCSRKLHILGFRKLRESNFCTLWLWKHFL